MGDGLACSSAVVDTDVVAIWRKLGLQTLFCAVKQFMQIAELLMSYFEE